MDVESIQRIRVVDVESIQRIRVVERVDRGPE